MNDQTTVTRSSSFPRDTLEQASAVIRGWKEVGTKLMVPNLELAQYIEKIRQAQAYLDKAERLKAERALAIRERNQRLSELWDLTKRVRNAAKATFGDHSPELEMLLSNRKEEDVW